MATIKDVARLAGVSIATVSRVINNVGAVRDQSRERVLDAVARLSYYPNAAARSLKSEQTRLVGVLLPHIGNLFFMDVAKGVEDVIGGGYSLILASSDWDPAREFHHLKVFAQQRVDAIVLITVGGTGKEHRDLLRHMGVPVIVADRSVPGFKSTTVLADNIGGVRRLTSHLLDLGHRRIGLVNGPHGIDSGSERWEGYCQALAEAGIEVDPNLVASGENFSRQTGYQMAMRLLAAYRPTALVAGNNTLAVGVLLACQELGIRIPQDLSVVSFGDLDLALLLNPPLTVATNSGYEMGREVGQLLLRNVRRPAVRRRSHLIRIASELIVRSSTALPAGASPAFPHA